MSRRAGAGRRKKSPLKAVFLKKKIPNILRCCSLHYQYRETVKRPCLSRFVFLVVSFLHIHTHTQRKLKCLLLLKWRRKGERARGGGDRVYLTTWRVYIVACKYAFLFSIWYIIERERKGRKREGSSWRKRRKKKEKSAPKILLRNRYSGAPHVFSILISTRPTFTRGGRRGTHKTYQKNKDIVFYVWEGTRVRSRSP